MMTPELADIGAEAMSELGLARWRVWYADAEPEVLVNRRPTPDTAFNIRFQLTDGKTFLTVRFRVEKHNTPAEHDAQTKEALKRRLRELGV